MRLKNLHIENFGTLADYDYDFCDELNVIKGENGFGKTTLGAFIKVMFYGFDNETKQKSKRERTKYKPWQGGVYGGYITFEHEGKVYTLSRTFGADRKDDTFELVDARTKLESDDFSAENIGEAIFDINAESFTRTLFISQNEYSHTSFTDIDAKIGGLVEATDDINNHDTAVAKLDKLLDEIGSDRKGALKDIKLELDELASRVLGKNGVEEAIAAHEGELEACKAEIAEKKAASEKLKAQLEKAAKEQDKQKDRSTYVTLLDAFSENKAKYDEERKNLPAAMLKQRDTDANIVTTAAAGVAASASGNPAADAAPDQAKDHAADAEVSEDFMKKNEELIKAWNYKRENLVKNITSSELSADEKRNFERLSAKFYGHAPDANEIERLIHDWSVKREELKAQVKEDSLSRAEIEELEKAQKKFADAPFDAEKNAMMIDLCKEHEELKAHIRSMESSASEKKADAKKKPPIWLGVVLIVVSLPLMTIPIVGILLLAAGIAVTIYGISAGRHAKEDAGTTAAIAEKKELAEKIERELQKYFLAHGLTYDAGSVEYILRSLADQHIAFIALKRRYEESAAKNEAASLAISGIEKAVQAYLQSYGYEYQESDAILRLNEIKEDYKRYQSLEAAQKENAASSAAARAELKKIEDATKMHLQACGYTYDEKEARTYLNEINEKANLYALRRDAFVKSKEKKETFEKEHPDYEELLAISENVEDDALTRLTEENNTLGADIQKLEKQRLRCDSELNSLNDQYNELCECEQRIKKLKQDKAHYKGKKAILEKTKKHLENAKNQLNAKYAAPLETALEEYFDMLVDSSDITIDVDAKRQLIVKSKGEKRPEENLSSGYKDLIDLCYRLALAKAMYPSEQPILILDDPFTNLDEEKLANGLGLVKKVSEDYQVLYLTCHGSRAL